MSLLAGEVHAWCEQQLPAEWLAPAPPEVAIDNEEILVVVVLEPADSSEQGSSEQGSSEPADSSEQEAAALARVAAFRELTREARVALARAGERRFGRKISWGARCGGVLVSFTALSVPVMTRLRLAERAVLDTLIDAGIARSRSEALAWCVRLVGENESTWIAELRSAFEAVAEVRDCGPRSRRGTDLPSAT